MGKNAHKMPNIPESMNDMNDKNSPNSNSNMWCALCQVYLGQSLSTRQRLRVCSVGRESISGPTNSLPHPPQLWTYCIHLNSICSPVEWSAVGPRLGWGSVESGARSAKRKPAPAGLLWLRVCMAEWEAHGWRHKMKCHMGQNQHSAEKSNLIKPAAKVNLTVYILV